MQNFGGQIKCIMEDVQVAYRLCKVWGGGGGEKGALWEMWKSRMADYGS